MSFYFYVWYKNFQQKVNETSILTKSLSQIHGCESLLWAFAVQLSHPMARQGKNYGFCVIFIRQVPEKRKCVLIYRSPKRDRRFAQWAYERMLITRGKFESWQIYHSYRQRHLTLPTFIKEDGEFRFGRIYCINIHI